MKIINVITHTHRPLPQTNHILMSKTFTEFENKVPIFLGIVGEPQLSDK